MKKKLNTEKAPGALGPYSQAVEIDNLVYTSGQLGIDATTGELADGVEAQTKVALENVKAILETAGLTMDDIIKTLVFITDMDNFTKVTAFTLSTYAGISFLHAHVLRFQSFLRAGLLKLKLLLLKNKMISKKMHYSMGSAFFK